MLKLSVRNGIDNIEKYRHIFEGKRLGLITNHTGVDRLFKSTIEILNRNFNLKVLYSPEHGLKGCLQAGEAVEVYVDELTNLPVYSLYGESKKPSSEILKDIDVLVFDIQDTGSRYYTFIYTMALAMESCAENEKTFVVLDRINPIGNEMEGNILDTRFKSFVGLYPLPVRYGLTIGELAGLLNNEYGIGGQLEVVKAEGWKRDMYFDETDLSWINTTPNMTSINAALLYNGTCLFEGTNISEGRGTTRPFEMIGAPWLNPYALADVMNKKCLVGVFFRPVYFEPMFSKHKGMICGGVQLHVNDRKKIKPFECGLKLLFEIRDMDRNKFSWNPPYREGGHYFIDMLAGTDKIRLAEPGNQVVQLLLDNWRKDCENFRIIKEKYQIYD